ncbi:hypothetical protein [Prosthecomicrobium pneumaticum]|uniref:Putative transcriptional regulator n=1 Tax=Prosthecomicrobium pneumaticum TaxID=81895 RepID=A0A7W9L3W8_9HYPH|nr:hypothetical protein [Prosthecomicrobium pneumaticum]MBB5754988.1 putative transcriptional regulator [Prosthecomicrobium pneumaticum]
MAEDGQTGAALQATLAVERGRVADRIIWGGYVAIGILIGAVVCPTIWLIVRPSSDTIVIQSAFEQLEKLSAAIFPLLGAWIGAVIAFYFARDNFESAAQNTKALLQEALPDRLTSIAAAEAMIPADKLLTVSTPEDDGRPLYGDILKTFEAKGLSRVIVLKGRKGLGVIHDSTVNRFVLGKTATGAQAADIKLSDLLGDPAIAPILDDTAIYVAPNTTLAAVRKAMEARSTALGSCRDAFVTTTGAPSDDIVGYLSDLDIAKRGALKS